MGFLQHQTGRNQITWENLVHLAQMVLLSHLPGPGLCNVFDGVEAASVLQSSVLSRLAENRESMRDVRFSIKTAFPDFMFPMLRALPLAWMPSGHWLFSSSFYQICPWLLQLRHKDRPDNSDKKQHGSLVIIYPSTRCKNMIHDGRGSFLGKSRFNWSAGVEELLAMFYIKGSVQWNKCQRGKGGQARMDRWHALLLHSISIYPWSVSILFATSDQGALRQFIKKPSRHMITNLQILNVILFPPEIDVRLNWRQLKDCKKCWSKGSICSCACGLI